jgi:hypothetical protein
MVNITIVVEGGRHPNDNNDAATYDNSPIFRESFHKLLSKIAQPSTFNLTIEPAGPYSAAIKSFRKQLQNGNCMLLIDSDCPKSGIAKKLDELTLSDYKDYVFFMVQEMEAWILSQPQSIIKTYATYVYKGGLESEELFKLNVEDISKPWRELSRIICKYYSEEKNGTIRSKKYSKLKDGPLLLANLNIAGLINTFEDANRLNTYLKK